MLKKSNNGITLVALVVTIIILLVLAGIAIATLGGENGLFARVKQAKKAHIQAEMQEQLTLALNELQVDKKGSASLDDVTQDWINTVISSDYSPTIKEDASLNGKLVVMNKSNITGKFLIGQNLEIRSSEYNLSSLEFEYETGKIENGKVKILIKITDKVNGIKQIDYPDPSESPLIMNNRKEPVGIDYSVELGKEYKFTITTGDGNKTEKIIKIDDYFYNVTKTLGESATIDNNATKAAYNKTYEATVSTEGNYAITGLMVTMGGQTVITAGNNVVDVNTGKIKIEKVTGDINITVTTKKLEIQYTDIVVSKSNSSTATSSEEANTIEKGKPLYINIIATLEGNKCTAVLKSDNSKTVPYAITANGKYTFIVRGTYNGKTIEEEKEVIVNQYKAQGGFVQYDAGNWTQEEIQAFMTKINIDKIDRKILQLLLRNARMPYLEIARECGISGAAIHQRIKKLEDMGVIQGSRLVVAPKSLGFDVCAFISIRVNDITRQQDTVEQLKHIPEIVECHYITGEYDYMLKVTTTNTHTLEMIMNRIKSFNGIKRTQTNVILSSNKLHHSVSPTA